MFRLTPWSHGNHCYIFVFPDLCLDKQTNLSAQLFILAQHVSTIRPWSRAAFYWTEFTFTSHEVKVNFVSKLDINQKSESKDPHWQSISSELFEKTPAPQGLVFPLLVLSLLTLPNQNHSPPPSLSPTILSFLCSSSVPSKSFFPINYKINWWKCTICQWPQ